MGKLILMYNKIYPSRLRHGLTLAYRLNSLRKARFKDLCPFPTGVINGPFKPTLLRLTESIAPCGIPNFPSGPYNYSKKTIFTSPHIQVKNHTRNEKTKHFLLLQVYELK